MLVIGDSLEDLSVRDLPGLLSPGDVLVLNDTRVIPARLKGRRRKAKIEVTLHREVSDGLWRAFARPARRLKQGDIIEFADGFVASVFAMEGSGEISIAFDHPEDLFAALHEHGEMPLPPYIERSEGATEADTRDYQTIYAARDGAVASPTAGLHFTDGLLQAVRDNGVTIATVTLHVGAGTFLPVRAEHAHDHRMHSERGQIDAATAATLNSARAAGGSVIAVGTTSLRLLESAAAEDGTIHPFNGETDLFILPGYHFRAVDRLMTNFHLPKSTLFMLVSAFAGLERMKRAYSHAIETGYRFYSYGDSCLIHRSPEQ